MEEKTKRLKNVNKLVKVIGHNGRHFFWSEKNSRFAKMILKNHRLYWVDEHTGKHVYLHYKYWNRGFSNGGTLRQLVNYLKNYVMTGEKIPKQFLGPWPSWYCDGDPWGYGKKMIKIRKKATELGMY